MQSSLISREICYLQAYYDEMKSQFPSDLHELCRYIASAIGYHNFSAETAIVNYYHMSGDMGPHKDISEIDHDAPLLSFRYWYLTCYLPVFYLYNYEWFYFYGKIK